MIICMFKGGTFLSPPPILVLEITIGNDNMYSRPQKSYFSLVETSFFMVILIKTLRLWTESLSGQLPCLEEQRLPNCNHFLLLQRSSIAFIKIQSCEDFNEFRYINKINYMGDKRLNSRSIRLQQDSYVFSKKQPISRLRLGCFL